MKLIKIEINNFRQFYGEQSLKFSTDPHKNITLIHAENGTGKTALLNAVLWCLFKTTTSNFENAQSLLNLYAESKGQTSLSVGIEFEYEDKIYLARRSLDKKTGEVFQVFEYQESGSTKPHPSPEFFVSSIIPREMANYFFFQGEGAGSFTNNAGGKVREAIQDILGFTIANAAYKDLDVIKKGYRKEYESSNVDKDLKEISTEISKLEGDLSSYREKLSENRSKQAELADLLKQAHDRYRNSNIEVVRQQQNLRDQKEKELRREEQALKEAFEVKADLITEYATSVFSKKVADEGIDFIDDKELKGTIPAPFNVHLVEEILSKSSCICGAPIHEGTSAYANIQALLAKAADPILQNRVTRARGQLTGIRKDLTRVEEKMSKNAQRINRHSQVISELQQQLANISSTIIDVPDEEIKTLELQVADYTKRLSETNRTIGSLEEREKTVEEKLAKAKSKENILRAKSPRAAAMKERIDFVESLMTTLSTRLTQAESDAKSILNHKVNEILKRYVKQDYHAAIDANYNIHLLDAANNLVGKSDGQKLLLSLTFISSLISLAADRANASGDILLPGAMAPFIIDAPFGVLDNQYKANIALEIPRAVDQVAFLLSSSHWEGTVEEVIREKVGAEYNLVLHVESDVKEDVSSTIKIKGKDFPTVIYNADVTFTEIREV